MSTIRKLILIRLHRLPMHLIRPPRKIPRARDSHTHKEGFHPVEILADVERLQRTELIDMLLEQISELVEDATALSAWDFEPPGGLVRLASGGDGEVDVFGGAGWDGS